MKKNGEGKNKKLDTDKKRRENKNRLVANKCYGEKLV